MKKAIFLFGYLLLQIVAVACPVCERQKPKLLRGITHGTGPQNNWDYVIVVVAIIITLLTLFYSIKWMLRPGEKSENHIKRNILNNE